MFRTRVYVSAAVNGDATTLTGEFDFQRSFDFLRLGIVAEKRPDLDLNK